MPFGLVGSAQASSLRDFHAWGTTGIKAGPAARSSATPSPYFAGYEYENGGEALNVTTTIVVPKVTKCTKTKSAMYPSTSIESVNGTSASGVYVGCSGGKAKYYPVLEINGTRKAFKTMKVKPGDKVVLTTKETSSTVKASLADKTNKKIKKTLSGTGTIESGGPIVGVFAWPPNLEGSPTAALPVPKFKSIQFSNSKINSKAFGSSSYSSDLYQADLYNSSSTKEEIRSTSFTDKGESFKAIFVAS